VLRDRFLVRGLVVFFADFGGATSLFSSVSSGGGVNTGARCSGKRSWSVRVPQAFRPP
jgi:hypothetical protein